MTVGLGAVSGWALAWWLFLRDGVGVIGFAVPVVLGVVALVLAWRVVGLRADLAMLRAEMQRMHRQAARDAAARAAHAATPEAARQAALPLDAPPGAARDPDLTVADMLRALEFPRDARDSAGLQVLDRARAHGRLGPVVQAAQDLMTLLGDDGIYADDLDPPPAAAWAWRACAEGATQGAPAPLGFAADAALPQVHARLGLDPVFRDTAHHFMRRVDSLLVDMAAQTDDATLAAFGRTRTGKCFRLIGTALGAFAATEAGQNHAVSP